MANNDKPRRVATCQVCGHKVYSGQRGPQRMIHKACEPIADAMARLERAVESIANGEHEMKSSALLDMRHRIFCMASEMPRPRYPKGHKRAGQFVKRTR